jgi:hypothetical protein
MTASVIWPLTQGAMGVALMVAGAFLFLACLRLHRSANRLRATYDDEISRLLARAKAETTRVKTPPHQSSGGRRHGQ